MKLITNNTNPLDNTGVVIRADLSSDGKSTTYKVFNDGILLDTITDNSVLTTAGDLDPDTVARKAQIKANAYSKVSI